MGIIDLLKSRGDHPPLPLVSTALSLLPVQQNFAPPEQNLLEGFAPESLEIRHYDGGYDGLTLFPEPYIKPTSQSISVSNPQDVVISTMKLLVNIITFIDLMILTFFYLPIYFVSNIL
jgi:hypothetical protein